MRRERRAFVRHPTALPVEITVTTRQRRATARDVGAGGLCLRVAEPVARGASVVVTLPVLDREWRLEARVVWIRPCGDGYEVGVCFEGVEERTRARLVEQICQIEAYRAGEEGRGRRLSSEEAAAEWAARHAASFPEL